MVWYFIHNTDSTFNIYYPDEILSRCFSRRSGARLRMCQATKLFCLRWRCCSPGGLLLSCCSPFGISVVDAAAAVAAPDDSNNVIACPVGCIPPPRLRRRFPLPSTDHCCHQAVFAPAAANLVVVTLLSAAAILPCNCHCCRCFLSAADTLIISCFFVDCCVIAICSQCFLTS